MEDALPLSQSFSKLEEGKSKTRWLFDKVEHRLLIFVSLSISPQSNETSALRSTASLWILWLRQVKARREWEQKPQHDLSPCSGRRLLHQKTCPRVVGRASSAGKVVKNLFFFSGGNMPRQSIAAWPCSPETDTRHIQGMDGLSRCLCPASMAAPEAAGYHCLYKAGGKDEECLCESIGG